MARICPILLTVWMLAACPDDKADAEHKCTELISAACARVASCAEKADVIDEDYSAKELHADCADEIDGQLNCARAVGVSEDYGECLSDVKKVDCDDSNDSLINDMSLLPPPSSCDDVILLSD